MPSQVSTRVVPIVRPTPHALVPAALPSTIGDLKALKELYLGNNALTGMCFCSTSTTPHMFLHHRHREGPREGSPPQLQHLLLSRNQKGEQRGGTQHGAARRIRRARARAGGAS